MISERFVVLARAYDPIGHIEEDPFFVNWDKKTPLDIDQAVALAEKLAMENPQNEYYIAELVLYTRVMPDLGDVVKTLEVS